MLNEPIEVVPFTATELYRLIQTFDRKAEDTDDGERDPEDAKLLTKLMQASNRLPPVEHFAS